MTAERVRIPVETGTCKLSVVFTGTVPSDQYGFVTFLKNNALRIRSSKARYTGIVSVFNKFNEAVNNNGRQTPPAGSGIDAFEFWCPDPTAGRTEYRHANYARNRSFFTV